MQDLNPIVVSYTNIRDYPGVIRLQKTLDAWGWRHCLISGEWKGFGHRLKRTLDLVNKWREEGITTLIGVDAFDVICTGPPSELGPALENLGRPALTYACEAAIWPPAPEIVNSYPNRTSHWYYPHSQFILDLTQPRPKGFGELEDGDDDQAHAHAMYLSGQPGIALDRECRIIQSIAHSSPWEQFFEIDGNRVVNKIHGSHALFVHANGKTDCEWVPVKTAR